MQKLNRMILVLALCAATGAALAQGGPGLPRGAGTQPQPPSLSQLDGNHDGHVTVAEADTFFGRMARNHVAVPPSDPPGGAGAPVKGRPGAQAQPPRLPTGAQLDSNSDGVISLAEFDAMVKVMPKPPRQ